MNYLLVMPKKLSTGATTTACMFPLGIAYVSAALKKAGHSVFTANLDFPDGDTYSVLHDMLLRNHIDVVGTGGLSLDCHKLKEVIDTARKIRPEIITLVGGGIISSDPETAMRVLDPDIGVIGEGEVTICELARALDRRETYATIPGLIYKDKGKTLVTTSARKEIADLDSIPFPDFDGFNYGQWVKHSGGVGMLISERSCPMRCTFCFHPTGAKYRQRSMDNIFNEIDHQMRKYNIKHISLTSELLSVNKLRIQDFCTRIKRLNILWSCSLRVSDVDAELLHLMKQSGCIEICFGLESADNSVLESMRKGINVDQIAIALDLVSDLGIATNSCNFIFGDIAETKATVANTMKFWWEYNGKTHINLCLIHTYPGTYLYEYACQNKIITDKEQFLRDGCPIINVSKLNREEFHELTSLIEEMRMHPHVPAASLKIVTIQINGNAEVEYVCRKCGSKNAASLWFWFTETCECSFCGVKNEVDAFRGASYRQLSFLKNLPGDPKIAMWGCGGIFYKLSHQYESIASDRFVLVDAKADLHGLSICKKIVHSPDFIGRNEIETVIITALSRKDEISASIGKKYSSVKNIFVPAFDVSEDGIVPILKSI